MRRESDRCADSTHFLQMVGRLRLPQGDGSALWRFMALHFGFAQNHGSVRVLFFSTEVPKMIDVLMMLLIK